MEKQKNNTTKTEKLAEPLPEASIQHELREEKMEKQKNNHETKTEKLVEPLPEASIQHVQEKKEENISIIEKLAEPLPQEAVQHIPKEVSKKGYDATGIGYQYCVNRFNEALGTDWGFEWQIVKEEVGNFTSGKPYYDLTVSMTIWIISKENARTCVGGHIASIYSDALKGAITNAFKKTAAFWGVGRQAYEGSLDIDMVYEEDPEEAKKPATKSKENNDVSYVIGFIKDVTIKKGTTYKGAEWERTVVLLNNEYYSTFDKKLGQRAKDLKGHEVKLFFKKEDKFLTIIEIEPIDPYFAVEEEAF